MKYCYELQIHLNTNDREHELKQQRDENDVADGLDGHYDTLDHMFQTLGTIDGTEGPQDTEDPKNLDDGDSTRTGKIPGK